jgi:N-alpha-acetyltransferase 15/16, NatA auxiliary subunit
MKALIFSAMGKRDEAHVQIKKVLFKNMGNFTCWHVMGILHRKDKEYDQARRAYIQALKINPTNESCLRDLCQLQMHLRDYSGFLDTRRMLLLNHAGQVDAWSSYGVACYLAGDFENASGSCDSVLGFNKQLKVPLRPNQLLEILVLKVKALEAMGNFKEAIIFIIEN